MSSDLIHVLIWNEHRHEKTNPQVAELYPRGMHEAIADSLRRDERLSVQIACLDDERQGIWPERLAETDVLIWWGHKAHGDVSDDGARHVVQAVWKGMGTLFLHSAHFSKPFKMLMGTGCDLKWRVGEDREILWVTRPGHPLVAGVEDHIVLPREEMYGEHFDIPEPQETVMISSFTGGEVFRSLLTWTRGAGKVVYFRPGHETYPTYHNPQVQRVIQNACHYATRTQHAVQQYGKRETGWIDR